jgi:hypothetical protein
MLASADRYIHTQYHRFVRYWGIRSYLQNGRCPWARGYLDYREDFLNRMLQDPDLLNLFRDKTSLPPGYGGRLDERVIEYPWVFAHLSDTAGMMLDAGSTLNFPYLLKAPLLKKKSLFIYTLSPEHTYGQPNVSYIYGDLRHTLFKDHCFQEVVCISTLEHIGMDNTQIYTRDRRYNESHPLDYQNVLVEFRRLLVPGGTLLLTIPYGKYQNMGWQQQFDANMLTDVLKVFDGELKELVFYRYSMDGWNLAEQSECENLEYFDVHRNPEYANDGAAAARAVVCIQLMNKHR